MTLLAVVACRDSTSPTQKGPPLSIIAGSGVTDTVDAKLSQALIVEVRGSDGLPARNVIVRFQSIFATGGLTPLALVAPLVSNSYSYFVVDTTDSRGRASALVDLGIVAGQSEILIQVPELNLEDTARYTALPGAAANLNISIRDTMVTIGAQYSLSAAASDRYGNKRPDDKITFSSRSAVATVDASGKVTAAQEGRGTILVSTANFSDSAQVSVVLLRELVVWSGGKLSTVNTDGSQPKLLTTSADISLLPQWSPDGTKVLFYEADPASNARISTVDMNGIRTLIVGPNDTLRSAAYGRFTRDGSWIYFTGLATSDLTFAYVAFRIKPDGTQLEQVGPTAAEGGSARPDVSPDGTTEVFVGSSGALGIMDIATHTIKSFGVTGTFPRYSPDGTQIAYLGGYNGVGFQLYVMKADGTNSRLVSPANVIYQEWGGVDWSPDGQWLIASTLSYTLDLVRPSDGLRLPLRVLGFQAAWKP